MPTAVVTGAGTGIGLAFAEALASRGYHLVLVARDGARLGAPAAALPAPGRPHQVIPADLATTAGCRAVEQRLADATDPVDLLVNNAGAAPSRPFPENPVEAEEAVLDLNVRAVLRLTHAALPGMMARRSGGVLNVASVAALGPGWLASTYPPSKSWVLAFTESVGRSAPVRRAGVRMTAVLPGYTRTEFHRRAGIDASEFPAWMWLSATRVAATALRDLDRGRAVSIPGVRYRLAGWAFRHLPRPMVMPWCWDPSRRSGTGTAAGHHADRRDPS
ncbi:SDR family NAD(P)-dependent oxidoreductase [Streptomyces sp. TRM43335]|uniref:SDR family NAD(P)-dependent oxidoreductase n=1 Tax=Streptomyces taklimakanensis TaxID=2569853 RepID=A0A6G2BJ87_9ACTN|nr:SDR family NAD(P)-dependent oxidoreductase [Streptomyces taklimakanensis]MTE22345.1 SDR family NAD(P)-dependent oxidoreductase [Streptomyces taklimakanensis]